MKSDSLVQITRLASHKASQQAVIAWRWRCTNPPGNGEELSCGVTSIGLQYAQRAFARNAVDRNLEKCSDPWTQSWVLAREQMANATGYASILGNFPRLLDCTAVLGQAPDAKLERKSTITDLENSRSHNNAVRARDSQRENGRALYLGINEDDTLNVSSRSR